jgi:hypothetical protein
MPRKSPDCSDGYPRPCLNNSQRTRSPTHSGSHDSGNLLGSVTLPLLTPTTTDGVPLRPLTMSDSPSGDQDPDSSAFRDVDLCDAKDQLRPGCCAADPGM